ncbi:hypothetical protein B7P43_G02817 [Cryptotermes secundus]|uniref:Uncharacterized protein n=1 Tax=Cryptotermes secundus TaxID=105785 RepID=A0A2J7RSW6_9NEOP|nr:hypothetical protein B7P43_G02817 [Cryptotermes secundus]
METPNNNLESHCVRCHKSPKYKNKHISDNDCVYLYKYDPIFTIYDLETVAMTGYSKILSDDQLHSYRIKHFGLTVKKRESPEYHTLLCSGTDIHPDETT